MASVCGSTLSLMDAGVPIHAPVAGVAMGLITDQASGKLAVLTDIQGLEDFLGDMDFKVAGSMNGITALQMDIKIAGINRAILQQALRQALEGRLHILKIMLDTLGQPREELSAYAPKIIRFTINPEKIREVIGPGGKMINKIIAETGVKIDIEDDGRVFISTPDQENIVLLGIRRRGIPLAQMLLDNFSRLGETGIPVGSIDISLYRDDLSLSSDQPVTGESEIPCDLTGRTVILVDDVIYTGRTARAAIEAVFHFGRPQSIQLAVLIDRGHRELPIRPDYVGKNIPTSHSEIVSVMVEEIDGCTGVRLYQARILHSKRRSFFASTRRR